MLTPVDADIPKRYTDEIKQDISEMLSLDQEQIKIKEQERRQQLIQELIPQIKEPIIL